jgi:hypothetical protein
MLRRIAIMALVLLPACAHPVTPQRLRAPNPNGCYAIVYEQPSFEGNGDVLNGPARLADLEQIPGTNQTNWHKRIRSLKVGPAASVTAFVETGFRGRFRQFGPDTDDSQLDPLFSARIQSLDIGCLDRSKVEP